MTGVDVTAANGVLLRCSALVAGDGAVLLVRHRTDGQDRWELSGGEAVAGLSLPACARRVILAATGVAPRRRRSGTAPHPASHFLDDRQLINVTWFGLATSRKNPFDQRPRGSDDHIPVMRHDEVEYATPCLAIAFLGEQASGEM